MIKAFEHSEYIVTPSGSCASMVHHYYKEMFKGDSEWYEKAVHLADRTYELTDFLVNVLGKNNWKSKLVEKAVFHQSCHMRSGARDQRGTTEVIIASRRSRHKRVTILPRLLRVWWYFCSENELDF